jgi:hypothetical protein
VHKHVEAAETGVCLADGAASVLLACEIRVNDVGPAADVEGDRLRAELGQSRYACSAEMPGTARDDGPAAAEVRELA